MKAFGIAGLIVTAISAFTDVCEAKGGWIWDKTIGRLWKNDDEEEIKIPPTTKHASVA
jgi:hypothetical protein